MFLPNCSSSGKSAILSVDWNASLLKRGVITADAIDEMQQRINSEIDEAIQQAEQDPYPEPGDCLRDVYDES